MADLPDTPRNRSAASCAKGPSNDDDLTGPTESNEKARNIDIANIGSERVMEPSMEKRGPGSSGFHKDVKVMGLEEEYLSPAEVHHLNTKVSPLVVRFHDATASPTSGLAGNLIKSGSMGNDRLEEILNSPSWRRGKSVDIDVENPFLKEETEVTDDDAVENEESPNFSPAHTNGTAHITAKNAQLFLKPEACVFVANLHTSSTDAALTNAVAEAFGKFGKVWVKIRRDPQGLPFAFCQYENREIADKAVREGQDTPILGRNCRTEHARASRVAYLSCTDGKPLTDSEAVNILAKYGSLEKVWRCTETEKELFRLHEGLWVKFAYYEQRRLAIRAFQGHKTYRLETYRPRGYTTLADGLPTPVTEARGAQQGNAEYVRRKNAEGLRASVFVGKLNDTVGVPNIMEIFGVFGEIKEVVIVSKRISAVDGYKTHAFVQYADPAGADLAVNHKGLTFNGTTLRVEFKATSEHTTARTTHLRHAGSPGKRAVLGNGRQKKVTMGANGVHANMHPATASTSGGRLAAGGVSGPIGYYPPNSMSYGNIGFANSSISNGPASTNYGQPGLIPNSLPGSIIGFNGQVLPGPAAFGPFTPYGQMGNPGSAWTYPPTGPYHG